MFINSIKRECEICGCEKNQHSNERCLSCLADTKKRTNKQHEYVDSSSTLERMSQYNLHLMYRSYGGFWL
ncbi:MAG: hypothetical protein FI718_09045 [SAR202 cluster bacterium]|nr:hypothetical protein [SAR202 cluster bacterium]